ncbi:MAG: hypothetical protein ABI977_32135 [Acidobacteriota bacterium]
MNTQTWSLITTVVLAFVGYVATYANNLRLTKRKERLELVNQRISQFYGPLYVISRAGAIAHRALLDKYGREWSFLRKGSPLTEEELKEWRVWVQNVFMPINEVCERLILENAYLIREERMPECLLDFVTHVSSYKAVIKKWQENDFSEHKPLIVYPPELLGYAEKSYSELKAEQLKLIGNTLK